MIYYLKTAFYYYWKYVYNSRKHEKVLLNNLIRNVTKVENIEKEIAGKNEIKVMLCDKKWKKIENKLNPVSLIFPRGGGETFLLRKICCFLLLLFYLSFSLFYFFSLFFVCVCVITFCGSFIILFWCYLIKNEINITKKIKLVVIKKSLIYYKCCNRFIMWLKIKKYITEILFIGHFMKLIWIIFLASQVQQEMLVLGLGSRLVSQIPL